jgi:uncharacterized protein
VFFTVRDLEVRARSFDVELAPGSIEYLDPKLRQVGPLTAQGKVELAVEATGEIRVKGHLAVKMAAECDRCLEPGVFPVDSDFELYYSPLSNEYEGGEERALDKEETEVGFYEGDGIELDDVLREFVLLALPMQRLCQENCAGICPVCGQNRNKQACECSTAKADDRWEALKNLKQ